MNRQILSICGLSLWLSVASAQQSTLLNASDPVTMRTNFAVDIESYLFHNESEFYALRLGYHYGLRSERHRFGMSLPLVHSVFEGDYQGFENTTGFGDLKVTYLWVPYVKNNTIGIERVTIGIDVSAPTGEYRLGRGAGTWLYTPRIVVTWRPGTFIAVFPEVRYQFSTNEANSTGGGDGVPDPEDPELDYEVQSLQVALPAVVQLDEWNGWFSLNTLYQRSFTEDTDFLFLRMDIGKVIGENASAALRISKFIAGQPRLNVLVQANFSFYFR
jgi:hypothetical protein